MRSMNLLENLEFHDDNPYAQPLFVDSHGRALRFTLKPGQSIGRHNAPDSPFYVVVLKGHGIFAGEDGQEHRVGPHTLLIFDPGENHQVRAVNEEFGLCRISPRRAGDATGSSGWRDRTRPASLDDKKTLAGDKTNRHRRACSVHRIIL